MGGFTRFTYHAVFATRYRRRTITDSIRELLHEYIGGILRAKKGQLIEIGGTADHVHLLARLSPSLAVADVVVQGRHVGVGVIEFPRDARNR